MKNWNTLQEMYEVIEELGYDTDQVVVDISRTPLESLYGARDVNYGDPPQKYAAIGFGDSVSTPWGPLPHVILLVRNDVWSRICGEKDNGPRLVPPEPPKPSLIPKNWRPAPGFQDWDPDRRRMAAG